MAAFDLTPEVKKLLRTAKEAGLICDEGFPSLNRRRENAAVLHEQIRASMGEAPEPLPQIPYVDVLIEALPQVRNGFAHPQMHTIIAPGMTVDGLILAAEIINQLWPVPQLG